MRERPTAAFALSHFERRRAWSWPSRRSWRRCRRQCRVDATLHLGISLDNGDYKFIYRRLALRIRIIVDMMRNALAMLYNRTRRKAASAG